MPYKVLNKGGGISGVFSKRKDASRYAKFKGLEYTWFFNFPAIDEIISDIKNLFTK